MSVSSLQCKCAMQRSNFAVVRLFSTTGPDPVSSSNHEDSSASIRCAQRLANGGRGPRDRRGCKAAEEEGIQTITRC